MTSLTNSIDFIQEFELPKTVYRSPGITAIYNELKYSPRNTILDLSSSSAASFQFFSQLSSQIHFEGIDNVLHESIIDDMTGDKLRAALENYLTTFAADKKFDVILAWDIFNYLDPATLNWLIKRLNQHCRANTLVHCIKYVGRHMPAAPRQYQLVDQYQINISADRTDRARRFATMSTSTLLKNMPDYLVDHTYMRHEGMPQDITELVLRFQPDKKDSKRQLASAELEHSSNDLPEHRLPHRSYAMEQICAHLRSLPKATVLNLGSRSTHSTDFFLAHAEEVFAEDLVYSLITPSSPDDVASALRQHALNFSPEIKFDVILAWDLFNHCSSVQLAAIHQKLLPHIHQNTKIFALFYAGAHKPQWPQKCFVVNEQNITLVPAPKRTIAKEDISAVGWLKIFREFKMSSTFIFKPGMLQGICEYIFQPSEVLLKNKTNQL